ncbi:hypothetical protein HD554DRAFT_2149710 [Boletus coccyginus]|nr:hypothetical protein HD554DRAFT_2149710 [Boletus coccyginus]
MSISTVLASMVKFMQMAAIAAGVRPSSALTDSQCSHLSGTSWTVFPSWSTVFTLHRNRRGETAPGRSSGARFHQPDAAAVGSVEEVGIIQRVPEHDRGHACRSVHAR